MERYQVILAYDGSNFYGSQFQTDVRTVQGVLENALRKLNWTGKSVFFAGRTDAGVHASGQVASFDLTWRHGLEDLRNAINALLPDDVAVRRVLHSNGDFHPRYQAISRTYQYHITCDEVRQPLTERYSWRIWPKPDLETLNKVAVCFLGVHDFAGYGRPTRPGGSTIREIHSSEWKDCGQRLLFTISGNAFLYHMVRRLVNAQVLAGQGKLEIEDLWRHLLTPGEEPLQGLAPPQGLFLTNVTYPDQPGEKA